MLVACIDEQYLVELDKRFVGYANETPLTILAHLTNTCVKIQKHEKVTCMEHFNFEWDESPGMYIKTYVLELTKR